MEEKTAKEWELQKSIYLEKIICNCFIALKQSLGVE